MTANDPQHFTITVDGLQMYYEKYTTNATPDSPTIVLIHGFLSSTFSFRRLIPLLTQNFNVIAIDFPPFGKSGKSKKFVYTYENIATIVVKLLEHLQIRKCILAGHSMGGQLCLHIMKQRPELVEKGVLLCSSSYLDRSKWTIRMFTYMPFFPSYLKRWLAKKGVKENLLNVVYDSSMIDEEMMNGYEQPFTNSRIFPGLARLIRHREADLSPEQLQQINTECLLIWGSEDRVVPLQVGKRLNKDLRRSKLIVLDRTGHLIPEERPDQIYSYIKRFLVDSSTESLSY
ncbi:alpha/beta fold hydrolase [Bacillus pinisoli]|uniref:alpha/beta fold hydrolase n=1 Tax=Bacillus pinisoli TaxID=2901866 RepID=UPI001FF13E88|nr:alpha/beta hydrolase [Bacillus pinisoli]